MCVFGNTLTTDTQYTGMEVTTVVHSLVATLKYSMHMLRHTVASPERGGGGGHLQPMSTLALTGASRFTANIRLFTPTLTVATLTQTTSEVHAFRARFADMYSISLFEGEV